MLTNQQTNKGEEMIQSKVQMDGFEQTLNCLYDPSNQYWNGFANPYFDQTNFDKWVAWLKQEERKLKYQPQLIKQWRNIK